MSEEFKGKAVLVSGAGSGIGREAALLFAQQGAIVYAADLNEKGLAETRELAGQTSGSIRIARVDVSVEAEVAAFIKRIDQEAGRLDAAFNNAGITGGTYRIEDYPTDDFDKVLSVNLRSVFLAMKYELPLLKRSGGGTIVNTASVAALTGPGGMSAYAASKHGVHGLTRVAAMENAAHNIRINAIAPGWTETPMVIANSAQNPAFAELARKAIPAKRGGQPSEIAAAAVWLSSPLSSYVFGQMLVIDGGMTIGGFEF
ncbi:SDR family NAD(P)-dependent oxidoreductase [Undibacterium sp.]|jgi:NAD(P)-dependent dehydrogenase (short-subunit alcohol dehydrogenase family)|uniref:SDR family NAD(P)-dependent oxidoreductase n=1 Tax=Undibacterium sp. TaxID=1914977 RepID=UPI002C1DD6CB|nr:SDR family NAD(P)-dependent oxidoreductase [Undibacterium sp.]HTD04845.1 SDR family NAD(P)-dependent oxidoreductase [Undibacterium sp.]